MDERINRIKTNWYVITGGPGSGKTTVINQLNMLGYHTTIEHARHFIDTQLINGQTVEEIRKNQVEFQKAVLDMQITQENSLSPDDVVFLDRALPDALAYYRFLGLTADERLEDLISGRQYKKVFILERLPLVNDYARREDENAQIRISELITEVYKSLPSPVVHVPVLNLTDRVKFILNNL